MSAAELAFEYLALALETTRGTAITNPTHYLPLAGALTPVTEFYRPEESRGTLAQFYRSKPVRRRATWKASGGADPNYAPLLFNMTTAPLTSPTTPSGATLARLWTFTPAMTSDTIKSATFFGGDPNVQIWQAAYCLPTELSIESDASGTDGVTMSISGEGRFPARIAAPTLPAQIVGDLLMPGAMQLWIDTSSAIGTTEVTGRFISTSWTIPTGVSYKYFAGGTAGTLSFSATGRGKFTPTMKIRVQLDSASLAAEFATWEAGTPVKLRARLNGSLIETGFYSYIEMDIYGPLDAFAWGDLEGTNRTMEFQVMGEYNATLGAHYALRVQNARTTL